MTPEQAGAWLEDACLRVCVLAYGLPSRGDSTAGGPGGGIGAGTRRLLWYGPTATPGNVGPMQQWETLLANASAPALPLPPDWTQGSRTEGDLTATTPPGPPSPPDIAPRRTMDDLRRIALAQAQALLIWAGNPTNAGGAQASVMQIVNTFGAIVDTVSNRLATLAASAASATARGASTLTTELRQWLHTWAVGSYALWTQARDALASLGGGAAQGFGFGLVILAALAFWMFTRKNS